MPRTSRYAQQEKPESSAEWRAGLYIRLSKEDGDRQESESISSQKAMLERFVAENRHISLYKHYIDDGYSGTDFNRPSFAQMIADVTQKKINCIIVKDLSRFGRNYVEAGKYLEFVFPTFNLRFIAVNDGIDSVENPSSANNIIVPFKNIINDEYCRDISVKVRSALDIRRKQGKFIGSFAPYGYKKDPADHNKLIVDEDSAEVVRSIFKKFSEGYSIRGIVRELNGLRVPNPSAYKRNSGLNCPQKSDLWVDSTVRRILGNRLYIGDLVQKKNAVISYKIHKTREVSKDERIISEGAVEAIIDRRDFLTVQGLLKRDTRTSPHSDTLSLFSGFVRCADCGRAMQKRVVKQPYKTYEYYVCSTYRTARLCTKHAIRTEVLEEAVLTFLNGYIKLAVDFERLLKRAESGRAGKIANPISARIKSAEQEREKCGKLLLDIYPDYKAGVIGREQYFALKERYENRVSALTAELAELGERLSEENGELNGARDFVSAFKKYRGMRKLTRDMLCGLVDYIYVKENNELEIHVKFRDSLAYVQTVMKDEIG